MWALSPHRSPAAQRPDFLGSFVGSSPLRVPQIHVGPEHPGLKSETWATHPRVETAASIFDRGVRPYILIEPRQTTKGYAKLTAMKASNLSIYYRSGLLELLTT